MKYGILLSTGLILLAGCSSSAQDYAKQGDWDMVGYSDGVRGKTHRSHEQLSQLGEANLTDYGQGYLRGNAEYCDPNHAYQIGLSGSYYEGVCEGTPNAQRFRMEWQRGWNESNH